MGLPASSILARLKSETAAIHKRVEQQLDVFRPDFDLTAYRALLSNFYGLYGAWEPWAIERISGILPGFFEPRAKLHLLETDLMQLGLGAEDIDHIPKCEALSHPMSAARTIGGAYVFEGSTLGGQVLSRHFRKRLGVTPGHACAFFSGYGASTQQMWRQFAETVERYAGNTSTHDEIVAGAQVTFAAVLDWFARK